MQLQAQSDLKVKTIKVHDFRNSVLLSDLFTTIEYLPLETNANCYLSYPVQIEIFDSLIFIQDHREDQIFTFSMNGKFRNSIGKIGKGPGELIAYGDFFIDSNNRTIEILDNGTDKMQIFGFDGNFINSKQLIWCSSFKKTLNGDYLMYSGYAPHYHDKKGKLLDTPIVLVDNNGDIKNRFRKEFEPNGYGIRATMLKDAINRFGDTILFCPNRSNIVFQYFNTKLSKRVVFDFGSKNLPQKYSSISDLTFNDLTNLQARYILDLANFIETEKQYAFTFNYQNALYQALVNKQNDKQFVTKSANFINDLDRMNFKYFHLISYYNNSFVFYIHSIDFKEQLDRLLNSMKKIEKEIYLKDHPDILRIYNGISNENNPILVFFKCK